MRYIYIRVLAHPNGVSKSPVSIEHVFLHADDRDEAMILGDKLATQTPSELEAQGWWVLNDHAIQIEEA